MYLIPRELKAGVWTVTCMPMFNTALFTIAKMWKQPKYLSTDKWMNKKCYNIYNGILLGHKKEIKFWYMLQHGWVNLENNMLSEISQTQYKYCMIPLYTIARIGKFIETDIG